MLKDLIPTEPASYAAFVMMMAGLAMLIGWGAGLGCRRIRVPMVVGYIIVGIVLGKSVLGLFSQKSIDSLIIFTYLALAAIGFDIGGEMAIRKIKALGRSIISISALETLGATVLVTIAIFLYTREVYTALVFGALAAATAPAATVDVLREYQSSGPLTTTTFAVVGIDDAYAVIIYTLAFAIAKTTLPGGSVDISEMSKSVSIEIFGSIALGVIAGIIFLFLIRNYSARRGLMVLTWAAIVTVTGLANLLGMQLILANMALGMTVVNVTRWKREDVFEIIRGTTQPIYVIFFVLIGAQLDASLLVELGVIGLLYIVFRSSGKISGAYFGGVISNAQPVVRKYLGLCLFSQAGVAIGLAQQTFNELRSGFGVAGYTLGLTAISVIAATSLVFQLAGPSFTRYAVFKSGEANV